MSKRRVNISIDSEVHDNTVALLSNIPNGSFSSFIEEACRDLVRTLNPVIESAKLGNNLHAFAQLQVAAAEQQRVITEGLSELSQKFAEEIHTQTVIASKTKVKDKN